MAVIDVGSSAIDRTSNFGATDTWIDLANPVNGNGVINSVEIWANTNMTGCVVGTFYGSGTNWTCRDYETIGNVTSGSKQTFSVSLEAKVGDIIGIYFATGTLDWTSTGGSGTRYKAGSHFVDGEQTYSSDQGGSFSVYGTGISTQTLGEYISAGSAITKGLWHFNGNMTDSSGNNNNGTSSNVTFSNAAGKFGQGGSFNGSSSYANIPFSTSMRSSAMTLHFWIRRTQASIGDAHYELFGNWLGAGGNDWTVALPSSGGGFTHNHINFIWYPSSGAGGGRSGWNGIDSVATASTLLEQNKYVLLTVTRPSSGLAANSKMYINGVPVAINTFGTTAPTNDQTKDFPIFGDGGGRYFGADGDEAIYEPREWSAVEIQKYYTNAKGRFGII
jgi:hypothetical protein